jgi:hypothetical protein
MKKYFHLLSLFMLSLIIAGCGAKPIPDWRYETFGQLENYKKNYLKGKDQIAEFHFRKALEEVNRSGDLELISKVYLTKYAIKVASLEDVIDSEYPDIEVIEPNSENQNFFVFLKGNFPFVDANLLPKQYGSFLKACIGGKEASINDEIEKIGDPLSTLIAVGIIVKKNIHNEATLQTAIETASINGWQKPLLAYLEKLQHFYEAKNENDKAAKVQQKIKVIKN